MRTFIKFLIYIVKLTCDNVHIQMISDFGTRLPRLASDCRVL